MTKIAQKVSKFRIALYGILISEGRVLMTETSVPSGSIINFPGGGLELGEAPVEAIEREFIEETGLSVSVNKLLFCSQTFQQNPEYQHEQLMHIYYRVCQQSDGLLFEGNNDDVLGVHWFKPAQIPLERVAAVDKEFINHRSFLSLF